MPIKLRPFRDHNRFWTLVGMATFYTAISFAYSFIGFLHYQPGSHFHEYSGLKLVIEVGGHLLFGFIAAIPFLDFEIAILTAALAILIDVDHLLSALNFDVSGRPDHSILFAILSTLFLIYMSGKTGFLKDVPWKLALVIPVAFLAHLSYDIFASNTSTSFQVLIPFSFGSFDFQYSTWIYFEVAAVLLGLFGSLVERQRRTKRLGNSGMKIVTE